MQASSEPFPITLWDWTLGYGKNKTKKPVLWLVLLLCIMHYSSLNQESYVLYQHIWNCIGLTYSSEEWFTISVWHFTVLTGGLLDLSGHLVILYFTACFFSFVRPCDAVLANELLAYLPSSNWPIHYSIYSVFFVFWLDINDLVGTSRNLADYRKLLDGGSLIPKWLYE